MGDGSGTTSHSTTLPDRRGRRRPYPNPSQQYGQGTHHNHRRFQLTDETNPQSVKPNYPTKPFGNDVNDALQFPAPMVRRSSLEEAVRNGRNEAKLHAQHTSSAGRSVTTWEDNSRAIQEVVSVLGGGQAGLLCESRSDLLRMRQTPAERIQKHDSLHSDYKGHSSSDIGSEQGHLSQGSASRTDSSAKAEGNQAISSGPSAIDLFDQCGFVPRGAVEKEGLVGTTNTLQSDQEASYDNMGVNVNSPSMVDSAPKMCPIVAPRAPLVPGGVSSATDIRGLKNHPRDARRHEARTLRTKRTQAASLKHGVQPRPPYVGGNPSTLSRSKHAHQQGSSSPGKGVKTGEGVPSDATEPTSRGSRTVQPSNVGSPCSTENSAPVAQTDSTRVRRRWNVDEACPTAAAASVSLTTPARATGAGAAAVGAAGAVSVDELYPESMSPSASASLSASEQRIASAKVRLHKDKDLNALKLEHVEALSILQDISCPSTATATASAESSLNTAQDKQEGGDKITSDASAVEATINSSEKSAAVANSSDSGIGGSKSGGGGAEAQGLPVEAKLEVFAADLPRIGSQEQAALREMYRKWWMKVANGGSLPSPCTPTDLLEVSKAARGGPTNDRSGQQGTGSKDVPSVGQQGLLTQAGVEGNSGDDAAQDLAHKAAADLVQDSQSNAFGVAASSMGAAVVAAVRPHSYQGVGVGMAVVVAEPDLDGSSRRSKTHIVEEKDNRAEDTVADQRGTGVAGDLVLKTTDVSEAGRASDTDEVQNPPAGELSIRRDVPFHIGVEVAPRKDGGEGGGAAAGIASTTEQAEKPPTEEGNTASGVPHHIELEVPPRQEGARKGGAAAAVDNVLASQQQQQQQAIASDVESVSEDDGLEKEQEEGHHGRIYLPDGRFVSTWHNNPKQEKIAGAVKKVEDIDTLGEVVDNSAAKQSDDESAGYEDEEFEE